MENNEFQLTPQEKTAIRERLLRFVQEQPVITGWKPRYYYWSNIFTNFKLSLVKTMPIIIILAVLFSGGVSLGAEGSLPGDLLYPVKIGVNEEVRAWFAVSDEAEAAWSARRAERRLEEAEKLAVKGRLNEEARSLIEENFLAHAEKVKARINKFENSHHAKALEVNSIFHTSLNAHAKILESIGISLDADVEPVLVKLADKVKKEKESIEEDREDGESRIRSGIGTELTLRAADGKLTAANNKIEEVRRFVNRHSDKISPENKTKIETYLKLADNLIAEGKAKMEAGAYGEAFILFQKAHNFAQETKLLVQAKIRFESGENDGGEDKYQNKTTTGSTILPSPQATSNPKILPSPTIPLRLTPSHPAPSAGQGLNTQGRVKIRLDF